MAHIHTATYQDLLRANHFGFQRAPVAQRTAGETRTDRVSAFERDAIGVVDYAGHELPLRFNVTVTNYSITRRNSDHDVAVDSFELR